MSFRDNFLADTLSCSYPLLLPTPTNLVIEVVFLCGALNDTRLTKILWDLYMVFLQLKPQFIP
jgi:hypothetical protein